MDERLVERVVTEEGHDGEGKDGCDDERRHPLHPVRWVSVYRRDLEQTIAYPFETGCVSIIVGGLLALASYPVARMMGPDALAVWHVFSPAGSSFGDVATVTALMGPDQKLLMSVFRDGNLWLLPGLVHVSGLFTPLVGVVLLVLWATFRR